MKAAMFKKYGAPEDVIEFVDRPLLRRELVDNCFLSRDKNGYEYRKVVR